MINSRKNGQAVKNNNLTVVYQNSFVCLEKKKDQFRVDRIGLNPNKNSTSGEEKTERFIQTLLTSE